jgi:hypothetical protein
MAPGAAAEAAHMSYERIDRVYTAGGETVQVRFDLTDDQLRAVAHVADSVKTTRYRCAELTADDVIELRELMAIHDDAHDRASDGFAGGTLVMTVGRLGILVGVLREWRAGERAQDVIAAPHVDDALDTLADLHTRALRVALGADEPDFAFS